MIWGETNLRGGNWLGCKVERKKKNGNEYLNWVKMESKDHLWFTYKIGHKIKSQYFCQFNLKFRR